MYQFKQQLQEGNEGERALDAFFADSYAIAPATRQQQRIGIDRVFTCHYFGQQFTVEYKTDKTAARTGNAFIETLSVSTTNTQGWIYTAQADFLAYYIPGRNVVYVIAFDRLRSCLLRWIRAYPTRRITNRGYYTEGLLVPLAELETIARCRVAIRTEEAA